MELLGLGTDVLHVPRPDLVIARISGFGQDGPMAGGRAYDPIVQAESGMAASWTAEGPLLALPDLRQDRRAVARRRRRPPRSSHGRAAEGAGRRYFDAGGGWVAMAGSTSTGRRPSPDATSRMPDIAAVYRPWATGDGWIVVVMLSQSEFEGWARAIGAPELPIRALPT